MPVYVDDAFIPYGRMKMSHMVADTLEELHQMADDIGVERRYFQNTNTPHYDVCKAKREQAISLGAIPVTSRKMAEITIKMKRKARAND